jgi:transposase InsO family protein
LGDGADNPKVKRVTFRETVGTTHEVREPFDAPPMLVPVLLNGETHTGQIDTGATRSCISRELAASLGLTIQPMHGEVEFGDPSYKAARVGISSPFRVQAGQIDILYRCEVLGKLGDAQFLIGCDLTLIIGYDHFTRPFREPAQLSADVVPAVDAPIPLIATECSEEEKTPEFQQFRNGVTRTIEPELLANAVSPAAGFCPTPRSNVPLLSPAGKFVHRRQYPLPHAQRPAIDAQMRAWLQDGVIERVTVPSPFNTPYFVVPKKDHTGAKTGIRICHDFRPLNALIPSDNGPLPLISDIFEALAGAQVFSTLDLRQAYHRLAIAEEDRHKTAFTWNDGQFQFRGAPFGLKTLPAHFQRVMIGILDGLEYARVFIDDVVVFSKNRDDHAAHLKEVIRRLNDAKLILNVDKCQIARLEVNLLGFRINPYGRRIDPSRLINLADWPVPTTAKQLQSFLGFVNYLRDFVPNIAVLAAPLNAIRVRDDILEQWTPECAQAFQALKDIIPQCPPLAHPDFDRPFYVATDASATGIGAVLHQLDPVSSAPRYIQFQARALSKSERNYSATKRELLAVVFAFKRFHHYLYGRRFTLYTDHKALTHLHTQPHLNPMLQSWYEHIYQHDFAVIHRPGIHNVLPDRLSRFFPPLDVEGESVSDNPTDEPVAGGPAQSRIAVRKATTRDAPDKDVRRPARTEPAPEQHADIIHRHHLRGHFGIKAVIASIREEGLDWPNLADEVKEVCANCRPCLRHNIAKRGYHPLSPISADKPFDHVAIDLAGPFPTSSRGNHYLFVLVDIHSRFVWLRALPDKKSATIGAALFEAFTTFGFPKVVQSDNGTEFVNRTLRHLFGQAKVDHRLVSPYHPRANGVAERTVQTVVNSLKKLLEGESEEWDAAIPFTQFAVNAKVATIHNSAPFAVVFGRSPNKLTDFSKAPRTPSTAADVETSVRFMQEVVFPGIAELARTKQHAMKKAFDGAHATIDIPIGAHVMVRNNTRISKLEPRFEGPYKVIRKTRNVYTLQDNTGEVLPRDFPPSAMRVISSDTVLDSPSYEVDKILNHRNTVHGREYLVRWKGYSGAHNTWEPPESFDDESAIRKYLSRRRGAATRR